MATQNAKNKRYQMVVDTTMSMTQSPTEKTDDMTLQMKQWSAFTASQTANQEQQLAAMQKQLEDCMRENSTSLPAVINTESKDGDQKQRRGSLTDGPEGVTKVAKFYKSCDNVCWSCGYDVSKHHHSGDCKKKRDNHNNTHTGANPQPGASQKDKEFLKWK